MITPTIGDAVLFHPNASPVEPPDAAVIAYVYSISRITLAAFRHGGEHYTARDVVMWDGAGNPPRQPYCEYPEEARVRHRIHEALRAALQLRAPETMSVHELLEQRRRASRVLDPNDWRFASIPRPADRPMTASEVITAKPPSA